MVIGLGGVGSWLAEALVRTGVGHLTIIDGDTVEIHNTNRQLPACPATCGRPKAEVLAERFLAINPALDLTALPVMLGEGNIDALLHDCDPEYVGEAIDDIRAKARVAATLHGMGKRLICSGGAGGRTDPTRLRLCPDLARAQGDGLISHLREVLRREYGFPGGGAPLGIPCTCSDEPPHYSDPPAGEPRKVTFGAAMAVTATAGMLLASWITNQITSKE